MPITEVWKDIKGYEGLYQISNLGNIKSLDRIVNCPLNGERIIKGCLLKTYNLKQGYLAIKLFKNNIGKAFQVHRLIACAFIDNINNKPYVNHINGIKTDNTIKNLEWVTCSENNRHAYDTGLKKASPVKCIETNIIYKSMHLAGRILDIGCTGIWACCNKRVKTSGGFHWEYANLKGE